MRLGLVLAQVGDKADIKVTDDEVKQALVERVRQYPGQESQVWDYYQKNPQALAEIRAPLFEEKVVDHVLAQVKVSRRSKVSEDEAASREGDERRAQRHAPATIRCRLLAAAKSSQASRSSAGAVVERYAPSPQEADRRR